jgi:hypothetical protein
LNFFKQSNELLDLHDDVVLHPPSFFRAMAYFIEG